jgi:hypothetical protein
VQALELFCEHVRDQLSELAVFLFELPKLSQLQHAQPAELLASDVERRLRDPILRQISSTDVPFSAYPSANAVYSSLNFDFFVAMRPPWA